ncbi:MAG TPA: HlyC/CorC family transporter [Chloroflexi bacterium]|nr:HlyC/CorC family transporter [Chloroflexota bacterium]
MTHSVWLILLRVAGVFFLIGVNAFFVMVEFAVVASRRTRIDQLVEEDGNRARIVQRWVSSHEHKDALIAAAQLGITIASLALGYLGEETFQSIIEALLHNVTVPPSLESVLSALPLAISLTVVTGLHVVLGEQVPKVAALRAPERLALFAAPWMDLFQKVFHPFVWLLDRAAAGVLHVLGMEPMGYHSTLYSLDELRQIVRESEEQGVLEAYEEDMLQAIFRLRAIRASQVMVPRTEMVCVPAEATLREVAELAARTALTKFPVFEEDLDHILGVVHLKDLVARMPEGDLDAPARSLMREALFLPETISVVDLLTAFRRARQHIAILVDEYGGTAGLVTLEDLLEEIVGEVQDAFDRASPTIQRMPDGSVLVDGLAQIEEVNEILDLALEDPYYTTIGGLVMGLLDRVPRVGDEVAVPDQHIRLRVEEMDGLRVARVRIIPGQPTPAGTSTSAEERACRGGADSAGGSQVAGAD